MSIRRARPGAWLRLLLVGVIAALPALLGGGPADAHQLDATAWWSVSNAGPIKVPAPPDVAGDDLLVQGAAPGSGLPDADPLNQAVAAVSFTLAGGEEPGPVVLALKQATTVPPSIKACRVTATFQSVKNGAWSDVPRHDCSDAVAASLSPDNASVAFGDTTRFVSGSRMVMLLVPAGPTRVVLAPPTTGSLLVTRRDAQPVDANPAAAPAEAPRASPAPDGDVPASPRRAPLPSPVQPEVASPPPPPSVGSQPAALPTGSASVSFPTDSLSGKLATAGVLFLFLAPLALRGQFTRSSTATGSYSRAP